jgi:hypothetical protein
MIIHYFKPVIEFKGRSPATFAIELPLADTLPLQQIFNPYVFQMSNLGVRV